MSVTRIAGEHFRRFPHFAILPAPRLNLVTGDNAAGKTSLLEALHVAGRGRSFRGARIGGLRRDDAARWRLAARLHAEARPEDELSLSGDDQHLQARLNGAEIGASELAHQLPLQILEPGLHRVVEDGPGDRRRYLDWGVFHVEPSFLPAWRRYRRALLQRNRALKSARSDHEISAWDADLADSGETLQSLREEHLQRLRPRLAAAVAALLQTEAWRMDWQRGWAADQPLAAVLREQGARDRRAAQTLEGPHRAELKLQLEGRGVKNRVSRGQQKLLVAALMLAQAALIRDLAGLAPVLLVDDFPAELGAGFQARLLDALRDSGSQVFLTAIERREWPLDPAQDAWFHVEHGQVERRPLL